jgi:hypothetical protein
MKPKNFTRTTILFLFCFCSYLLPAQQFVNLVKNPGINENIDNWGVWVNSGSGFLILPDQGINGTGVIQTGLETKLQQEIDLIAAGYSEEFLDKAPIIRFSDWIKGSGPMTNDKYFFSVFLNDENGNLIYHYSTTKISSSEWQQVTHNIMNYGPGLRKILILREGLGAEVDLNNTVGLLMDAAYLSINNNLLYADSKTGDLAGWTIEENGGDGWISQPSGFQTSFGNCSKSQTIDLLELGYTAEQLDAQPSISLWEFFVGFNETGSALGIEDLSYLRAELRDANGNVLDSYDSGSQICNEVWQIHQKSFSDYDKGLRYIYVQHGGQDVEFWAEHYGSVRDATTLTIDLSTISTGVEDIAANNKINVYPNLVEQGMPISIEIENDIEGMYSVELFNITGKKISESYFKKQVGSHTSTLQVDVLKSGVYYVKNSTSGYTTTKKLIVR